VVCAGLSSDEPEVNGGRINTPSERTGSTTNGTVVEVDVVVGGIVVDDVVLVVEETVGVGATAGDGSPPLGGAKVVVGATVVEVDVVVVGATVVVVEVDVVVVGATVVVVEEVVVVEVEVVVVGATVVEVEVVVVGATVVVVEEVVVVGATVVVVVVVDEVVVVVVDSTTLTLRPAPNATTASESPIVPAVRPADAVESDPRRPLAPLPQHFNIALSRTAQV
jgi:hypothetical protein